jgi:ABC-type maltose transport system permease subunit
MSVLAAIRPDSWTFPLFVHVLGAMILVGGTLTAASALAFARGEAVLLRLGYWSLLAVALPGYILMRIGAQWIYSKEGLDDAPVDAAWTGIGFLIADLGALLLLLALIVGGIGVRRLRFGGGKSLLQVSMVISLLLLAAYVVAIWAMAAKPD